MGDLEEEEEDGGKEMEEAATGFGREFHLATLDNSTAASLDRPFVSNHLEGGVVDDQ